jgi:vesicle coat complex subunit
LDEPEARASMIWIIGEYAERIDNADELLHSFLDGFQDENSQVQLQLLTAIVKLFLKKPTETQDLVQNVLTLTTQVGISIFSLLIVLYRILQRLSL